MKRSALAGRAEGPEILLLGGFGESSLETIADMLVSLGAAPIRAAVCDILRERVSLDDFRGLVISGEPFLNGLPPGKLMASEIEFRAAASGGAAIERFRDFALSGKPVAGLGSGFQTLVETGLLPDSGGALRREASMALFPRDRAPGFEALDVPFAPGAASNFLKGLSGVSMPPSCFEAPVVFRDAASLEKVREDGLALFDLPESRFETGKAAFPGAVIASCGAMRNPRDNVFGTFWRPERQAFENEGPGKILPAAGMKFFENFVALARKSS